MSLLFFPKSGTVPSKYFRRRKPSPTEPRTSTHSMQYARINALCFTSGDSIEHNMRVASLQVCHHPPPECDARKSNRVSTVYRLGPQAESKSYMVVMLTTRSPGLRDWGVARGRGEGGRVEGGSYLLNSSAAAILHSASSCVSADLFFPSTCVQPLQWLGFDNASVPVHPRPRLAAKPKPSATSTARLNPIGWPIPRPVVRMTRRWERGIHITNVIQSRAIVVVFRGIVVPTGKTRSSELNAHGATGIATYWRSTRRRSVPATVGMWQKRRKALSGIRTTPPAPTALALKSIRTFAGLLSGSDICAYPGAADDATISARQHFFNVSHLSGVYSKYLPGL